MKQWLAALLTTCAACGGAMTDGTTSDTGSSQDPADAGTVRTVADSGSAGRADARVVTPRDAGLRMDAEPAARDAGFPADAQQVGRDATPTQMIDAGPVPAPANDRCAQAATLDLSGRTSGRYEMHASTAGATHEMDGPCAQGGADIFFRFTLQDRSLVYADTFGASWDTVLYFARDCATPMAESGAAGQAACNDNACGSQGSQIAAALDPGEYFVAIGGARGESGPVTLHFEWAIIGRGAIDVAPQGTNMLSGTTSGTGRSQVCEAGGPENTYWWMSCPADQGGPFLASTCNLAAFDTIAYLQIPRGMIEACADDSCHLQSRIESTIPPGAGLNVITVDGLSGADFGPYQMQLMRP